MATHYITTFYFFSPQTNIPEIRQDLETQGQALEMKGLFILGPEGLNSTCSAPSVETRAQFQSWIKSYFKLGELKFKDSESSIDPFPRFKVKVRPEIVTMKTPGLVPPEGKNRHLTPEEWEQALKEEGVAIIDTRNDYEYRLGTFEGAVNPGLEQFSEFPPYLEKHGYKKDQKILIFCTGGIRCEKGILELENRGYKNVYQLEGGILNYLEEKPEASFKGECFVFDHRVAVDQNLKPSQIYGLCPHCGDPGEVKVDCVRCDIQAKLCPDCAAQELIGKVCSKNCAHHVRMNPGSKGKNQKASDLNNLRSSP